MFFPNNIPLYVCTTFCLSVHPLMDTWVASTLWLLQIVLLSTWAYKYLFRSLLSILSCMYPEVELLDHIVILFLIFWGTAILFSIMLPWFFCFVFLFSFLFCFVFGCVGLSCSTGDLHCGMRDPPLQHSSSVVAACGLSSCGSRAE